jgi:hypothetical protein
MTDLQIATAIGVIGTAILGVAGYASRSMIRTVREAARVVGANGTLKATVEAQALCIAGLERNVRDLTTALDGANKRIAELERILGDWETVRRIKSRRVSKANED